MTLTKLALRVGGVYRSRAGERVEIDDYDVMDKVYPFHGNNGEWYTKTGLEFKGKESPADLIAEWTEPTDEVKLLQARVEELEARIAELELQIPQPTVMSAWTLVGPCESCTFDDLQDARVEQKLNELIVRHDTITAPDGSVTYAVEVEK